MQLGARARDQNGNEYVYCSFSTGTVIGTGSWVTIGGGGSGAQAQAFRATGLTAASHGPVGIVVRQGDLGNGVAGVVSDMFGWVQVYGYYNDALLVSDAASAGTSSAQFTVPTTISTPVGGVQIVSDPSTNLNRILNAFALAAVATDVTANSSHTGLDIAVWLNYPFCVGNTDIGFSSI